MATNRWSASWVSLDDEGTPPPAAFKGKTKPAPLPAHQIPGGNGVARAGSSEESQLDRSQPVFVAGTEGAREVIVTDDSAHASEVSVPPRSVSPFDTGNTAVRAHRVISVDRDVTAAAEVVVISDSEPEPQPESDSDNSNSDGPRGRECRSAEPGPGLPARPASEDDNAHISVIEEEQEEESEVEQHANRKRKRVACSDSESDREENDEDREDGGGNLPRQGNNGRRVQSQAKRQKKDGKEAVSGQSRGQNEVQSTRNEGKQKRVGLFLDHIRDPDPENPITQDILRTGLSWSSTDSPCE